MQRKIQKNNIVSVLEKLGLGENEALLYSIMLRHPKSTVQELATRSPFPRTMLYYVLNQLIQEGLVSTSKDKWRTLYIAENPERLYELLARKEKEIAKGVGGYARSMPADWTRRQAELVHERAKQADIIITTALIPGRKAPVLISEETVKAMKPGSVIVDLAVEQGGNCPLSECGKTVTKYGVHIIGEPNLATLVPADASALYARNVLDFLKLIVDKDAALAINREDEIVAATLLCTGGEVTKK